MIHIDLFSGIGGFSYAADQIWPNMKHVFCDIDPFARAVTRKHWPNAKHYADIKHLITDTENRKSTGLRLERKPQSENPEVGDCYLVTGGFPCQPFSQAGRRRGTADDRYLWPAMFRVIQLVHPVWVIAENVAGLVTWNNGMVLEQVCTDLESEGYDVQPFIIPAVSVNAPHRRDRVWIVANRKGERYRRGIGKKCGMERQKLEPKKQKRNETRNQSKGCLSWNKNWVDVATRLCRMDDGLPARVDGFELTKSAHRKERLKSLGNAIVPQVAMEIMRNIKETI